MSKPKPSPDETTMGVRAWMPRLAPFWPHILCGLFLALNLVGLLCYQHYLHGDFPFQDEWGYVARIQSLPNLGFWHYLFDRHMSYHLPVLLFIWYLFYALTHLNIEAIRYTGAVIISLNALLLCVMLRRHSMRLDLFGWAVILYAPFAICSLNHWATYNQSIESVIQPLLFGMVLVCCWMVDRMVHTGNALRWVALCVAPAVIGLETYGSGLSILPAAVAAYLVVKRRIDVPVILLTVAGIGCIFSYVTIGGGLSYGKQRLDFDWSGVLYSLQMLIGLTGDAVFSPDFGAHEYLLYVAGAAILIVQLVGFVYVAFLPAERRKRFMVPVMLTAYNFLVFLEILITRFHNDKLEATPRYSILMLAGPMSVLFYLVLLEKRGRWGIVVATLALVILAGGTAAADRQVYRALPYMKNTFAYVRRGIIGLSKDPDQEQERSLFLGPGMGPLVYPDRLFLEKQHLAMYRGPDTLLGEEVQIKDFGPANLSAGKPFNVQKNGESALWIKLNRYVWGDTQAVLNGTPLQITIHGDVIIALIPESLFARPGSYPLYIVETVGEHRNQTDPVNVTVH